MPLKELDFKLSILFIEYNNLNSTWKKVVCTGGRYNIFQLLKKSFLKKYLAELGSLNFRLHAELKEPLEKQLEALPFVPLETDIPADEGMVRTLQEQLQLAKQVCEIKHLHCFISLVPWQIRGGCFLSWFRNHLVRVSWGCIEPFLNLKTWRNSFPRLIKYFLYQFVSVILPSWLDPYVEFMISNSMKYFVQCKLFVVAYHFSQNYCNVLWGKCGIKKIVSKSEITSKFCLVYYNISIVVYD